MMIWTDPVRLPWSDDEREELGAGRATRHLARRDARPACTAGRRAAATARSCSGSGPTTSSRWSRASRWSSTPPTPRSCIRGMSRLIPALSQYLPRLPKRFVDGGYYTKTEENRLLSGPLPVEGAYVLGGLSGYGMMSSNGAADLLADYIAERPLPRYAPAFRCPATRIRPTARSWRTGAIRDSSDRGTVARELSTAVTLEKRRTIMAAKLEKYCAPRRFRSARLQPGHQGDRRSDDPVPGRPGAVRRPTAPRRTAAISAAQARAVFGAVKTLVEAGGGTLANVVKITTYVTDVRFRMDFASCATNSSPNGVRPRRCCRSRHSRTRTT